MRASFYPRSLYFHRTTDGNLESKLIKMADSRASTQAYTESRRLVLIHKAS